MIASFKDWNFMHPVMIFVSELMWECRHGPPLKSIMDDNSCYVVGVHNMCTSNILSGGCLPKTFCLWVKKALKWSCLTWKWPQAFLSAVCVVCVQAFTVPKKAQEIPKREKEWEKTKNKTQNLQNATMNTKRKKKGRWCSRYLSRYLQCSTLRTWHLKETKAHAQPMIKQEEK